MKIYKKDPVNKIIMKTRLKGDPKAEVIEWWTYDDESKISNGILSTAAYLKTSQTWRIRQLAAGVRLYAGLNIYSYAGSNVSRFDQTKTLPDDRPTFNLIQACTDTLVARLGQAKPAPKFLTDNGDYHQRHLGEQLNRFIQGEFYQTKAYEIANQILRDSIVMGTGAMKVYEGDDQKVKVERVMVSELYCDMNDSIHGDPTQLYQLKLMDREKLMALHPKKEKLIEGLQTARPDAMADSSATTVNQVMVVEAWKLPTSAEAKDGRHVIACQNGVLLDEPYEKTNFPFVWLFYSKPFLGFFGQSLPQQLFGTQLTLNRILYTISKAITLVGVPRIFQEEGSKVGAAAHSNDIGVIVKYRGVKPSYEVAPCNAPELYAERDRLIQYGFQQCGISQMQASGQKPMGLNSGEAQRVYNDIATDRMSELAHKYDQVFIDLAYKITDVAMDIAKRDGKYQTVYPNKDGTKEIDLPKMDLLKDPFVIQCFNESSLPKDPAGRAQAIIERVQSGMITIKEGRRLLGTLDLEQVERLNNASEERIFKILDDIVEHGDYTPPDSFIDFALAEQLTTQYYNLYVAANLEEDKAQMLRDFYTHIQALKMAAQPPMPQMGMPGAQGAPANPMPTPQSEMLPNINQGIPA